MTSTLKMNCWSALRLSEAMEALARSSGLYNGSSDTLRPRDFFPDGRLGEWIDTASAALGLEAKPVSASYKDLRSFLRGCGPALIRLELEDESVFLAVVRARYHSAVEVLTPGLNRVRLRADKICDALRRPLEVQLLPEVNHLLDEAGLQTGRSMAANGILRERLGAVPIEAGWLLRLPAGSSLRQQVREHRLVSRLALFIAAHTADALLLIGAWWMVGKAILEGRLDLGWLAAWLLILITRIPFQLLATWMQGRVAISAGGILKRRLLEGSLRLQPEEVRRQGVGQLLGRVIESEALESLALGGGMTGLLALVEIILAAIVLTAGAGYWTLALLLIAWTGLCALLSWRYFASRQEWTDQRLDITNDLIERMAGHRTRVAQEDPERWHDGEDESLERYLASCKKMDRRLIRLSAIIPRGWTIASLLVLIWSFLRGQATPTTLAVAVGGILLALGALKKLTAGLSQLGGAAIAWRQVRALFDAGCRASNQGVPEFVFSPSRSESSAGTDAQLLEAREVSFTHQGRSDAALKGCSLQIARGDRILLEGASGAGKSTFAALLAGLRQPDSGLILHRGLDLSTYGEAGWHRRIALAPQCHENHIFTGTLAFNLLMGRRWPPRAEDVTEAAEVCRELGLGELLERMPAGLFQQVGESGWQLSFGERSRIFLARALLQNSEVVILDESLGPLDPEILRLAMDCAMRRAESLIVVAHL